MRQLILAHDAGYKVGVMEQIETGEEAKKRDKNAIVRRKLVNVETPATALEPTSTESVHLLSVRPVQAIGMQLFPSATGCLMRSLFSYEPLEQSDRIQGAACPRAAILSHEEVSLNQRGLRAVPLRERAH